MDKLEELIVSNRAYKNPDAEILIQMKVTIKEADGTFEEHYFKCAKTGLEADGIYEALAMDTISELTDFAKELWSYCMILLLFIIFGYCWFLLGLAFGPFLAFFYLTLFIVYSVIAIAIAMSVKECFDNSSSENIAHSKNTSSALYATSTV